MRTFPSLMTWLLVLCNLVGSMISIPGWGTASSRLHHLKVRGNEVVCVVVLCNWTECRYLCRLQSVGGPGMGLCTGDTKSQVTRFQCRSQIYNIQPLTVQDCYSKEVKGVYPSNCSSVYAYLWATCQIWLLFPQLSSGHPSVPAVRTRLQCQPCLSRQ